MRVKVRVRDRVRTGVLAVRVARLLDAPLEEARLLGLLVVTLPALD